MQAFYYFLSEQPNYPNEIYANSKQEVVKLLSEDLADPSSILAILTKAEFDSKLGKTTQSPQQKSTAVPNIPVNVEEIEEPPVDFNNIINSARAAAERNESAQQVQYVNPQSSEPTKEHVSETEAKYFEESGIKFKLVGGKLFKKVWTNLDENSDFRLINIKTNKIADLSKYRLEKLEWVEI